MAVPIKWFNKIFFRAMLGSFGFRSPYSVKEYEFEPYFQYSIGPYKTGYTLYFRKQPYKQLYKNEIFAKMNEYSGHDLTNYLGFHYDAYKDKKEFIRFLRYEASERLKKTQGDSYKTRTYSSYKLNLEMTLEWVAEQSAAIDGLQQAESQHPVPKEENTSPAAMELLPKQESLTGTDETSLPTEKRRFPADQNDLPTADLSDPHLLRTLEEEEALSAMETKISAISKSYSGKIALYNQYQMEKVIQIFILIQTTRAPGKKAEPLFERFTKTDIAALLRQFEENNNKKSNTLQGYVTDANNMLRLDDPKVEKLARALQDFFY